MQTCGYHWDTRGPSDLRLKRVFPNPHPLLLLLGSSLRKKGSCLKLRSERDTLVEALTTAGRAVTNRGSAQPVLSGVRLEVRGDRLLVAGSDLDLTIQVDVPVGSGTDGVCVIPARLASDIVRALEPGAVTFPSRGPLGPRRPGAEDRHIKRRSLGLDELRPVMPALVAAGRATVHPSTADRVWFPKHVLVDRVRALIAFTRTTPRHPHRLPGRAPPRRARSGSRVRRAGHGSTRAMAEQTKRIGQDQGPGSAARPRCTRPPAETARPSLALTSPALRVRCAPARTCRSRRQ